MYFFVLFEIYPLRNSSNIFEQKASYDRDMLTANNFIPNVGEILAVGFFSLSLSVCVCILLFVITVTEGMHS